MSMPTFQVLFKEINLNMRVLGIHGPKVEFRFYVMALMLIPIILEETGYFVTKISSDNFVTLAGLAPCIFYCLISVIKIMVIVLKREKLRKLTDEVEILYEEILNNPRYIEIARKDISLVNKLTKYLYTMNMMLAILYNFSSVIIILYYYITTKTIVYDLPFPVILPFRTDSWFPWLVVYIHSCACGFICITYMNTLDSLNFILVTIVCANYKILYEKFQSLRGENFKKLNENIKKHQYLIGLSEDLDDILRIPNFFNVLFGAIQICVLVFCATAGELSNLPGYLIFLSTVIAQMLTISIFGENIMSTSSKINEAVSNSAWYEADVKSMKSVMFIIARSQKPQRLTAYIFSTVCMASFTKIISNSWSYFSLLRTAYKPEAK